METAFELASRQANETRRWKSGEISFHHSIYLISEYQPFNFKPFTFHF